MEIIEKALEIASQAHEGQYRKHTRIPYITHPAAVGMILLAEGYEEEIVSAGILHDTIEDTALTLAEIEKMFGPRIANIVSGCSEPDKSLPWETRKEHTIEFLKSAPSEIRAVACADKLHNVRSILKDYQRDGEKVWSRFNRGKHQQEWYYRNIVKSLRFQGEFPLQQELARAVDQLFGNEDQ